MSFLKAATSLLINCMRLEVFDTMKAFRLWQMWMLHF